LEVTVTDMHESRVSCGST